MSDNTLVMFSIITDGGNLVYTEIVAVSISIQEGALSMVDVEGNIHEYAKDKWCNLNTYRDVYSIIYPNVK
jgi:hypothetical protein